MRLSLKAVAAFFCHGNKEGGKFISGPFLLVGEWRGFKLKYIPGLYFFLTQVEKHKDTDESGADSEGSEGSGGASDGSDQEDDEEEVRLDFQLLFNS